MRRPLVQCECGGIIVRQIIVRADKQSQHNLQVVIGKQTECRAVKTHILKQGRDEAALKLRLVLTHKTFCRAPKSSSTTTASRWECIETGQLIFEPLLWCYRLVACHLRSNRIKSLSECLARSGVLQHIR